MMEKCTVCTLLPRTSHASTYGTVTPPATTIGYFGITSVMLPPHPSSSEYPMVRTTSSTTHIQSSLLQVLLILPLHRSLLVQVDADWILLREGTHHQLAQLGQKVVFDAVGQRKPAATQSELDVPINLTALRVMAWANCYVVGNLNAINLWRGLLPPAAPKVATTNESKFESHSQPCRRRSRRRQYQTSCRTRPTTSLRAPACASQGPGVRARGRADV